MSEVAHSLLEVLSSSIRSQRRVDDCLGLPSRGRVTKPVSAIAIDDFRYALPVINYHLPGMNQGDPAQAVVISGCDFRVLRERSWCHRTVKEIRDWFSQLLDERAIPLIGSKHDKENTLSLLCAGSASACEGDSCFHTNNRCCGHVKSPHLRGYLVLVLSHHQDEVSNEGLLESLQGVPIQATSRWLECLRNSNLFRMIGISPDEARYRSAHSDVVSLWGIHLDRNRDGPSSKGLDAIVAASGIGLPDAADAAASRDERKVAVNAVETAVSVSPERDSKKRKMDRSDVNMDPQVNDVPVSQSSEVAVGAMDVEQSALLP